MTGHRRITALALVAGLVAAWPAAAEDKVLGRIDGQPITESEVSAMVTGLGPQLAQLPEAMRQRAAFDRIVDTRVLATAATKAGLDQAPAFKARLEQIRAQLLVAEFVKAKVETLATPERVKARYDKDLAAYVPPEEMRARHILVKTEDEAKAVLADLAKGGDFAKIAEEKSQDPGSAKQGGDLGYFGAGDMVPEFEKAAGELKVGETTAAPVKTQFGFHVIRLEDKRKQAVPTLEQVGDQVRQAVVGEIFAEQLADLKKGAKIEIDEAALAAAKAPTAPAPAK